MITDTALRFIFDTTAGFIIFFVVLGTLITWLGTKFANWLLDGKAPK